jgi:hypothetical protein
VDRRGASKRILEAGVAFPHGWPDLA